MATSWPQRRLCCLRPMAACLAATSVGRCVALAPAWRFLAGGLCCPVSPKRRVVSGGASLCAPACPPGRVRLGQSPRQSWLHGLPCLLRPARLGSSAGWESEGFLRNSAPRCGRAPLRAGEQTQRLFVDWGKLGAGERHAGARRGGPVHRPARTSPRRRLAALGVRRPRLPARARLPQRPARKSATRFVSTSRPTSP